MFLDYLKISMICYANHMILERKFLIVEIVLKGFKPSTKTKERGRPTILYYHPPLNNNEKSKLVRNDLCFLQIKKIIIK